MPSVSVIIPTYNHRDFVLTTLDSVFAQTFTDYEIIVINDGSPDDTADMLRPLVEAGRIRYIEQENTGQAIARNRGIAEARGEFIALLDDDDFWPPDKLEWQVEAMARYPDAGIVGGPTNIVDADGCHLLRTDFISDLSFEKCLVECPFVSPGQTLIRTDTLRQLGGLNPDIWGADDWDLWLRAAQSSRIVTEDRDALFYRKHAGNASKSLCRMVDNCLFVLDTHLAAVADQDREKMRRVAYLWLYSTQGRPVVAKIKALVKSGQFHLLPPYLSRFARFGKAIGHNPLTIVRIMRDFLPSQLTHYLHRPNGPQSAFRSGAK
jgi:glycosyltransferase involved in cell wall biosynthesis